jgi:outer membrane protein OmpA-like peptidoglycan-associated protein
MKKLFLIALIALSYYNSNAQSNLLLGAGGGLVYGVNEGEFMDIGGTGRVGLILTNILGTNFSPELGFNVMNQSSTGALSYETNLWNLDLNLRYYFYDLGNVKFYATAGLGFTGFTSKYEWGQAELMTSNGRLAKTYGDAGATAKMPEKHAENNPIGNIDDFYNNRGNETGNINKQLECNCNGIVIPVGIGVSYLINKDWMLDFAIKDNFTNTDNINPFLDDVNDGWWSGVVTINYNLGGISFGDDEEEVYTNLQLNKSIELQGVTFETGSSRLTQESNQILRKLLKTLEVNSTIEIKIAGHTDNVGKPEDNLKLSTERADAVKKWLVDRGIAPGRISAEGFGETQPKSDNGTQAGRDANRRVEFIRMK